MNYSDSVSDIAVKLAELQECMRATEAERDKLASIIEEQEATINAVKEHKNEYLAVNAELTLYEKEAKQRVESAENKTEEVYDEILSLKKELEEQAAHFEFNKKITSCADNRHALREKELEEFRNTITTLKADQEKELELFYKTLAAEQKKGPSDELFEIEEELGKCFNESDQLQKNIEELKDKINSYGKEIQALESRKNMMSSKQFEKKNLLFEVEKKIHTQDINRETLCTEIQAEEKKKEDMDLKRLATLKRINNIQNEIDKKLQEKSSQEIEICDLKTRVAELEVEKEIQNDLFLNCETVKMELAKCLSEREHLEKNYAEQCAGVELMKMEIQLNTKLEESMSELNAMKDTLTSDNNSLLQINEELKKEEEKFKGLKEKESKLQMENESMVKESCDIEEEIKLLNAKDEELSKNVIMLREECERLEQEVSYENKAYIEKQAKITTMAEFHEKKLAGMDKNLANLEKEASVGAEYLAPENDEEIQLCAQEINMRLKLQEIQETVSLKEAEFREMMKVLHEKQSSNENLENELLNLEREIKEMTEENKKLDAEIEKCKRPPPGIKRKVKSAVKRSVPYTHQRPTQKESVSANDDLKRNEKLSIVKTFPKNLECVVAQQVQPTVIGNASQKAMASNERPPQRQKIYVPCNIPSVSNMDNKAKTNFELEEIRMRLENSQITMTQTKEPAAVANECVKKSVQRNRCIPRVQKMNVVRNAIPASNVIRETKILSETIELSDTDTEITDKGYPDKNSTMYHQKFCNSAVRTTATTAFTSNTATLATAPLSTVKKELSKAPELKATVDSSIQVRRKKYSTNKSQRRK